MEDVGPECFSERLRSPGVDVGGGARPRPGSQVQGSAPPTRGDKTEGQDRPSRLGARPAPCSPKSWSDCSELKARGTTAASGWFITGGSATRGAGVLSRPGSPRSAAVATPHVLSSCPQARPPPPRGIDPPGSTSPQFPLSAVGGRRGVAEAEVEVEVRESGLDCVRELDRVRVVAAGC